MIDSKGMKGKHIIIKSDVEGGQWVGFRTFPLDYLDNVDQIMMEIHLPGKDQGHKLFWGDLQTMKSLGQRFVSVNMHMTYYACQNPERVKNKEVLFPSHALEVTLVNKKLIKLNSETRSYAIGSNRTINVISHGNWSDPDCQMHD